MLFKIDEVADWASAQVKVAGAIEMSASVECVLGKSTENVKAVMPDLKHDKTILFATAGLWSMHDLLFFYLDKIGSADVYAATWSMTEEPATMIVRGLSSGLIRSLHLLFDARIRLRNPKVFAFVKHNNVVCRLSSCHAKVCVIENEEWQITIVGSSNFTNNPRIESGVVMTDPKAAEFSKNWILAELDKAHPFK
jgi:hypothetical protein